VNSRRNLTPEFMAHTRLIDSMEHVRITVMISRNDWYQTVKDHRFILFQKLTREYYTAIDWELSYWQLLQIRLRLCWRWKKNTRKMTFGLHCSCKQTQYHCYHIWYSILFLPIMANETKQKLIYCKPTMNCTYFILQIFSSKLVWGR
jgi:hypothetical protein